MPEISIESFNATLNSLLEANPHARNKGDVFKNWCNTNFHCNARISHIREQRQTTNRVSEQFRYFDPIVVFVVDPEVKRDTLIQYVSERSYENLEAVAIIGVQSLDTSSGYTYTYEKLLLYKESGFSSWAKPFFDNIENMNVKNNSHSTSITPFYHTKQVIYYGTPGSGKSHTVASIVGETPYRTIFHPDSDYASFVGSYKPTGDEKEGIGYKFIPQVFINAYVQAWKNPDKGINLVIEEINRGNCAQIFGNLFQLLDRKNGYSEYPITPNTDLKNFLAHIFGFKEDSYATRGYDDDIEKKALKGEIMVLPPNLSIYATMNTSDQSLFPMDSAFKRRWDWEYVPVCYDKETEDGKQNIASKYIIDIDDEYKANWLGFLKGVNEKIKEVTYSEDKQIGNYFIKSNIDTKTFINKVMYYLWAEICKEEYKTQKNFFRYENKEEGIIEFSFNELFPINNKSKSILKSFIERMIAVGKK